ncbi:hypothetical protein L195_g040116, partial [Trifolium pratense]
MKTKTMMTFSPTHFSNVPRTTCRKLLPLIPRFQILNPSSPPNLKIHIPIHPHPLPLRPPYFAADQFVTEPNNPQIQSPISIQLMSQWPQYKENSSTASRKLESGHNTSSLGSLIQ